MRSLGANKHEQDDEPDAVVPHRREYFMVKYIAVILRNNTGLLLSRCHEVILSLYSDQKIPFDELKSYAALASDYVHFLDLCNDRPLCSWTLTVPNKTGFYWVHEIGTEDWSIRFVDVERNICLGYFWPIDSHGDVKRKTKVGDMAGKYKFCGPLFDPHEPYKRA